MIQQFTQAANLISNVPHNLTESGDAIATVDPRTPSTAAPSRWR